MNARRKRATKRPQSRPEEAAANPDSPVPLSRQKAAKQASAETALDECVAAISLIEVTMRSLESQEIASPEQQVLKRAMSAIWLVHDWMYELKPIEADAEDAT